MEDVADDARRLDEPDEGPALVGVRDRQQDHAGVSASHDPRAPIEPNLTSDAAPLLSLYAHNATSFACASCEFASQHLQELRRHRQSRHRHVRYDDRFFAQCACGASFASRAAATKHAEQCHSVTPAPPPRTEETPSPPRTPDVAAAESNRTASAVSAIVFPPPLIGAGADAAPSEPTEHELSPPTEHKDGKRRRLNDLDPITAMDIDTSTTAPSSPATQFLSDLLANDNVFMDFPPAWQCHDSNQEALLPPLATTTTATTPATTSCVTDFLKWSTMRANPAKCAALALTKDSHGHPAADQRQLHLDGDDIPLLDLHSSYQYLLQHTRPLLLQLKGYDRMLTKGLKHLLRLPKSTTTSFVYAPTDNGSLGFVPMHELHALLQMSNAWQTIHSLDPMIREVARAQVLQIIQKRFD